MLSKIIAWVGCQFMSGSGYEKRLHEELIELKRAVLTTNKLLKRQICLTWGAEPILDKDSIEGSGRANKSIIGGI
jgi:hypothetical protein